MLLADSTRTLSSILRHAQPYLVLFLGAVEGWSEVQFLVQSENATETGPNGFKWLEVLESCPKIGLVQNVPAWCSQKIRVKTIG